MEQDAVCDHQASVQRGGKPNTAACSHACYSVQGIMLTSILIQLPAVCGVLPVMPFYHCFCTFGAPCYHADKDCKQEGLKYSRKSPHVYTCLTCAALPQAGAAGS